MKKCKVCGCVSKDDVCSKDCKRINQNRLNAALDIFAPIITGKKLTPKELKMQEDFIKKQKVS